MRKVPKATIVTKVTASVTSVTLVTSVALSMYEKPFW